jgi:hypothetical protein
MKAHEHIADLAWLRPFADWGGGVVLCVCAIPCIRAVWRDGRIGSGIIPGWLGLFVWASVWGHLVPLVIANALNNREVWRHFSGSGSHVSVSTMGWLPALIASFAVWLVREVVILVRARRIKNQESKI